LSGINEIAYVRDASLKHTYTQTPSSTHRDVF